MDLNGLILQPIPADVGEAVDTFERLLTIAPVAVALVLLVVLVSLDRRDIAKIRKETRDAVFEDMARWDEARDKSRRRSDD